MNVELELLVARLRWPVASTRWWAMQELASLLLLPEVQADVSARLLVELGDCKLEAEAVEVLYIFWLAFIQGWVPGPELPGTVKRTSMLTDRLLVNMGLVPQASVIPPLAVAPVDFQVPSDFKGRQGRDVPRIYYTMLSRLERDFGLPFLKQLAYEWTLSAAGYPEAPFQGDLWHFVRPAGDRAIGSFANRTSLRMVTAFLRTLEVAQAHWRAPHDLMFRFACKALPLEPSLAFLRPARPPWLPALRREVAADNASVTGFIVDAHVDLEAREPGGLLLALTTPLHVSNQELVELTVVRWRYWGTAPTDPDMLWARFDRQQHRDFGRVSSEGLKPQSEIPSLLLPVFIDASLQAIPMAALHDFDRIGYLQRDLFPGRLYLSVLTGMAGGLLAKPLGGGLEISASGQPVALLTYWNAGWSPGHPSETSGLVGTALVGRADAPAPEGEAAPSGAFYLWRVTKLTRQHGYGPYATEAPLVGCIQL